MLPIFFYFLGVLKMYKLTANQIEELYKAYSRGDRKIATVLMTDYDIGQKIIDVCALEQGEHNSLFIVHPDGVKKNSNLH